MRIAVCFVLLFWSTGLAFGQVVAVQNDRGNIVYVGIQNPLTVAIEKSHSSSIEITTDNGTITGKDGHYILVPSVVGNATIQVKKKTWRGEKFLTNEFFRVKRIKGTVFVAGHTGGEISKQTICEAIAPTAIVTDMEIDAQFAIDRFTVVCKRSDKIIFSKDLHDPKGIRFDEETLNFFKTFQDKDKMLLTKLSYKYFDGTEISVPDIEFTITPGTYTEPDENETIVDPITNTEVRKYPKRNK